MINFFNYDPDKNRIVVNQPEILLIKEFADLWINERNKCEEDPDGTQKLRAYKELVYIYIAIDWRAPGSKDTPTARREEAIRSSGLTPEELEDPVFKAACKKYQELQDNSSVLGKLVETYTNNIHKMRIFVENIDYSKVNEITGAPIFKIKDTLSEMQMIAKAIDALQELEQKYKEEQQINLGLRGSATPGMFD